MAPIKFDRIPTQSPMPTQKQHDLSYTAQKALAAMPQDMLYQAIEAHIAARPDMDGESLEAFTNRLRKRAWRIQRGEIG